MDSATRRHPNVANLSEVETHAREQGTRFGAAMKHIAMATGARGIGCTWYEQPPGRTAFPRHYHCVNEEALYVLEGTGTVRIGDDEIEIAPGDWVTFPIGPDHAHQVINTGDAPLRYLCISTQQPVDVVGYPDSNKVAASATAPGNTWFDKPWFRGIFAADNQVGYFEGEEID